MNKDLLTKLFILDFPFNSNGEEVAPGIYVPTLSELIIACGNKFFGLSLVGDRWFATPRSNIATPSFQGDSPEEAVAKLWIALHMWVTLKSPP